jgi:hypothetical protein
MGTDLEGSDPGVTEAYPDIYLEGFEKTMKNLCQDAELRQNNMKTGGKITQQ